MLHQRIDSLPSRSRTLLLNLPAGAIAAATFLEGIIDAIGAVLAHLQEDPAAPQLNSGTAPRHEEPEPPPPAKSGLNADDFAAFLKRKRTDLE